MKSVLIFANGEPNDGDMVQRVLTGAPDAYVIAADGGARVAEYFNRDVDLVIGDMDSLSPQEVDELAENGAQIDRHPPEKDATDLELALEYAVEHGAEWVRVIGGLGGRFDQAMANVYLLALPALADCDVSIVAAKQEIRLLRAGIHTLTGHAGDTVSLIPVGGDVRGIVTDNLKYPLQDETLMFGPARGVSNVMLSATATVTVGAGVLLCVHTIGRA